ncbi:alpha/beta fold hydrolase [Telluribacter sp.]|jgi:pimeloyl-ACP methyl ester carboxylesterase|uniref:alpha/beta fold hydrolase n=1 Tax=Telluribacter sp. TaxID=1978767 RepID=UPI002E14D3AF|nr:alpha/beta fold hydrolase [Telluribacter sp.]
MELNYKKIGETGQPLLILHGLFGSLDNWLSLSKTMADQGYSVYLIDQRNHGRSGHHEDFSYEHMAADLKAFLEEHQLSNPILLGHSMGGKTVMQYAVTYPGTFDKLVVVDMAPKAYPVHHGEILKGLNTIPLNELEGRNQADELFAQHEPNLGVRQFLLKNLYRTDDDTFAWRFNLPVLTRDIENVGVAVSASGPISAPTLFMRGAKSDYVLDSDWEAIQKIFPNAVLDTIAGAGHWIHAEQPKAFMESLVKFMKS